MSSRPICACCSIGWLRPIPDVRRLRLRSRTSRTRCERRSPGYRANIARYNQVLRRVFGDRLVDVNALLPLDEQLISDGIHLTSRAHDLLAKVLAERVEAALHDSPGTGRTLNGPDARVGARA